MAERNRIEGILRSLRLSHEKESNDVIHESILDGIEFRGTNLWLLIFSILIGSVGMNIDSTAVIIGSMMISPLMGPIIGIGYSTATHNFRLLRHSAINVFWAMLFSILASTIYFSLSPIRAEQSLLLAASSPSIFDVLVAFFGGLAGIFAISSKVKGAVIPGVAVATALVPPLCAAGYGLASGKWVVLLSAVYLFLIYCVFIALAALLVTQFLRLPKHTRVLSGEIKNTNLLVIIVTLVTVIPSIYFGYILVQNEKFQANAKLFIREVRMWEGNFLINERIDVQNRTIYLDFGSEKLTRESVNRLKKKANDHNLTDVKLYVEDVTIIPDVLADEHNSVLETDRLRNENRMLEERLKRIEKEKDSVAEIEVKGEELLKEIRTFYPQVESLIKSKTRKFEDSTNDELDFTVVILESKETISETDKVKIKNWLIKRLGTGNLKMYIEYV